MKLFELFAELSLNANNFNAGITSATKQGKSFASTMSGGFNAITAKSVAVGHALYDMGKMAVRAAASFSRSVVTAYADTEQLIGGIETLFGKSADVVIRNSEQAYRTAGMSANEYMETVTGFSASLLQGLGGDTAAAARVADMAVQDMSDNANKMGTDMGMIMNAYQGFAKDNFSMLDNLKLGYGGTAEEMARLINDSGVLGDTIVTAATVSQVPLDKMFEAIHAIQVEMGITGTTAEEASSTITGSLNAFRAAWSNMLSGLGTGQDMDALADALFETGETLISNILNLLPRIASRAFQGIDAFLQNFDLYRTLRHAYDQGGWEAVADAGIAIFEREFVSFWDEKLPNIIKDGANFIIGIINSVFGTNIPSIDSIDLPTWDEISEAVSTWWSGIRESLESAASWTLRMFEDPVGTAEDVKTAISDWWTGTAKPAIEAGCSWVLQMFENPTEDQQAVKDKVSAWWQSVGAGLGSIVTFVATFIGVETENAKSVGTIVQEWWDVAGEGVGNVIKLFASFGAPGEEDTVQALKDIAKWILDLQKTAGDTLKLTVKIVFDFAEDALVSLMSEIEALWKSGLEAMGLGWLFEEDEEQLAFKAAKQAEGDAETFRLSGKNLAGEYAGLDQGLTDTMQTYGYSYLSTGEKPKWHVDEGDFDISNPELMNQWNSFLHDMSEYADALDMDTFWSWFEEPEGEQDQSADMSTAIDTLTASVASIIDAIAGLPSSAASAAASALNGAKVEIDGAAAGALLVPHVTPGVSAAIARGSRTAAKTAG